MPPRPWMLLALCLAGLAFTPARAGAPPPSGFESLYSFGGSDGQEPSAPLVVGSDGRLYGTAAAGGDGLGGVVFTLAPDGTGFQLLHEFDWTSPEPYYPVGLMEASDGRLYGVTSQGGSGHIGVVFGLSKDGTGFEVLHEFQNADGANPTAPLIEDGDGVLYGTAAHGGAGLCGTVFRLNKDGSDFQVLHTFIGTDGNAPNGLALGNDGMLYGTCYDGGREFVELFGEHGPGTIFRLKRDGTDFEVLHDCADGVLENPAGAMLQASDGAWYGVSRFGGLWDGGALFKLDGSGMLQVVHDHAGFWGGYPHGALVEGPSGALYGVTAGYVDGTGATVFTIQKDGSGFDFLHTFSGTDGGLPNGVGFGTDGVLYGSTQVGGTTYVDVDALGAGTIFRVAATAEANQPPTAIELDPTSVEEHLPIGSLVGTLQTIDANPWDSFLYELVEGEGSWGNYAFWIDGDQLLTAEEFDRTWSSYYDVRVRSTDTDGEFVEMSFVIEILPAPVTLPVTSPGDTGSGSLREAILEANAAGPGGARIVLGDGLGVFNFGTPLPEITGLVTLVPGTGNTLAGNLVVQGTLTVEGTLTLTGTLVVASGGTLQGNFTLIGTLEIQDGGTVSPGSSPGTIVANDTTWAGGGTYDWEIDRADGTAGSSPGWDLLVVNGVLDITADSANPFTVEVISLLSDGSPGEAANFDPDTAYSWTIATASGGITEFAANKFLVDAFGFQNDLEGGAFSVAQVGTQVRLVFTPASGPTAVQIISFTAQRTGPGRVELRWRTGVEYDVLGFLVERMAADGAWREVGTGLVPCAGLGGRSDYALLDTVAPEMVRYRLVEVDLAGRRRVQAEATPLSVVAAGIRWLGAMVEISITGSANTSVTVETTTDAAWGPWVHEAAAVLDGKGAARIQSPMVSGPRFFRVRGTGSN